MNNSFLVADLTESYTMQLAYYRELGCLGQRILGQVVLSRGDLTSVMPLFEEKERCMDTIVRERERVKQQTDSWQACKGEVTDVPGADRLDAILADTEAAIREFLRSEDQLKRYLDHMTARNDDDERTDDRS